MTPTIQEIIQQLQIGAMFRAILLLALGYILAKIISSSVKKALSKRLSPQQSMILHRVIFYIVLFIFIASAIQQIGFNIGALLGATGILTVAIGIASQTSMSNVISGIFIIGEKPFQVGDTIKVNDIQGEVLSIGMLSARIRTSDNTLVRIPNEMLVKSAITNVSYFPFRRIDIPVSVAIKSDLEEVRRIFFTLASENPLALSDPKPDLFVLSFTDSAINLQCVVWSKKENVQELKSTLQHELKNAFLKHSIEIPSTSYSLFLNNITQPLPIQMIRKENE